MGRIREKHFSPDKNFFYSFWKDGKTKNPPLVILPGFTGTHGDLVAFAEQFEKNFDVIIPDLPGWGDSPKGTYHMTIEGYADFVNDLLESLHISHVFLAGHCMGSAIAIQFAYKYPEKVSKLFLITVSYLGGTFSQEVFEHLAHESVKVPKFLRPFFFFFRSRLFAIPLGFFVIQTKSFRKKLSIILENTIKQQFQDETVVEKNWNSLTLFDYKKLRKLKMPIHMFHGEKDILVTPKQSEKVQAFCPWASFEIIPHAGHMPPVETPEALARLMLKYLT